MSSKVIVILEDDVDGSKASETITFAIDGAEYEIDLNTQNAQKLRDALEGYVSKARKVSGRTRRTSKSFNDVDSSAVRKWAAANQIELSKRGRIPQDVVSQYRAAGN